jgi:UDP-N-acetylglucosamine acyltransferase
MPIHPTAIIDKKAQLDSSVEIGAYAVIEAGVALGSGTRVLPHTILTGATSIGKDNLIGPFASVGSPPQDLHYNGEPTELRIGDGNQIREYVSIHRGTASGGGITSIGNNNMLMAYSHVAHDCLVGNHVILANAATLGGHVQIRDRAIIGGLVAVHQFTRIGEYAYIGGMSGISKDVPPYIIVAGTRNQMRVSGINKIGLRRAGFDVETIKNLHKAFLTIFKAPELLLQEALDKTLEEFSDCQPVVKLVAFFKESSRGVVRSSNDE